MIIYIYIRGVQAATVIQPLTEVDFAPMHFYEAIIYCMYTLRKTESKHAAGIRVCLCLHVC